jgi:hypothetical protein
VQHPLHSRCGAYRLARIAAKHRPEITLNQLLARLTAYCRYASGVHHPYRRICEARFIDLDPPRRPPDLPAAIVRPRVITVRNPHFRVHDWAASQPFQDAAMKEHLISGYLQAGLPAWTNAQRELRAAQGPTR